MADKVLLPVRITDGNGSPVANAVINIYTTATTTARSLFADAGETTPISNPVVTDGFGLVPDDVWVSGTAQVRAYVTTSSGALLYDLDPVATLGLGASAASGVSFAPTTEIAETTAQGAIEAAAELVAVSPDDTTPGGLLAKIGTGSGLQAVETNAGANEVLTISPSGALADIAGVQPLQRVTCCITTGQALSACPPGHWGKHSRIAAGDASSPAWGRLFQMPNAKT